VFLLVPAYPGSPGTKAVKRLLLLLHHLCIIEVSLSLCLFSILILLTAVCYICTVELLTKYAGFQVSVRDGLL